MVLPVLIWLASQNVTPLGGGLMLFIFGVGHGVPIIPIATFSRAVGGRIGEKYVAFGALDHQILRAAGDSSRHVLCCKVFWHPALVICFAGSLRGKRRVPKHLYNFPA